MRILKFRAWDGKAMNYDPQVYAGSLNEAQEDFEFPLMQFTGLFDKNGKEIYEGDILRHPEYCNLALKGSEINEVKWGETGDSDGYCYGKHFEYVVGENSLADVYEQSEIIGNIYESPELLKGGV